MGKQGWNRPNNFVTRTLARIIIAALGNKLDRLVGGLAWPDAARRDIKNIQNRVEIGLGLALSQGS